MAELEAKTDLTPEEQAQKAAIEKVQKEKEKKEAELKAAKAKAEEEAKAAEKEAEAELAKKTAGMSPKEKAAFEKKMKESEALAQALLGGAPEIKCESGDNECEAQKAIAKAKARRSQQ